MLVVPRSENNLCRNGSNDIIMCNSVFFYHMMYSFVYPRTDQVSHTEVFSWHWVHGPMGATNVDSVEQLPTYIIGRVRA